MVYSEGKGKISNVIVRQALEIKRYIKHYGLEYKKLIDIEYVFLLVWDYVEDCFEKKMEVQKLSNGNSTGGVQVIG